MKKRSTRLKWIGVTLAGLGALAANTTVVAHTDPQQKGMQAESNGGLLVYRPGEEDSPYWFQLAGRLAFDETLFAGGFQSKYSDYPSGANIRYARLMLTGGVGEYLTYNFSLNFNGASGSASSTSSTNPTTGNGGSNVPTTRNGTSVDIEDAWVAACSEYSGIVDRATIRFGQYTPPTSIDDWGNFCTVNDNFFLESSLASQTFLTPSKVIGLWADASAFDMFVLSASVHHPRQNNSSAISSNTSSPNNYQNPGRSDRVGGAARLAFVPVHTEDTVYHLGALGRYQSMSNGVSGAAVSQTNLFVTQPEARARNTGLVVNTGSLRARSFNVVSGEALAMWGPAWVEGEYHQANVQRVPTSTDANTTDNPEFHGWHLQGGYMLTGESRVYDYMSGTLRNPRPNEKCGAWEIAARFSYVNLVNKNVYGGSEHNTSIGVNWFVNENVRLAANYIRANIRETNPTTPGTPPAAAPARLTKRQLDIFGVRVGIEF